MAEEYITQVSEKIERRVTKNLSQEFSRTYSRILGALFKVDESFPNPQVRTCSVAVPRTSRNNDSENREPTGDRSPADPCPEAVFSTYHSSNLNDAEQEETHHRLHLITSWFWVTESVRNLLEKSCYNSSKILSVLTSQFTFSQ